MRTLTIHPEGPGKWCCDDLSSPGTPCVGRGPTPEAALHSYLVGIGINVVVQAKPDSMVVFG